MNVVLFSVFVLRYLINVAVAKEIIYYPYSDLKIVTANAITIAEGIPQGYNYYFSVYTNNIPITYILAKLYEFTKKMIDYPYMTEFIWYQVNCMLISLGGFFCCMTVKKITNEVMPTVIALLIYIALAGTSPWKINPYTDTYAMAFPIMAIYFYYTYREAENMWAKYLCSFLAIFSMFIGGNIKPSVYVVLIAIISVEILHFLFNVKKEWKYLLFQIFLVIVLLCGTKLLKTYMIEAIGLDFNIEIEAGWQHFFYMGLNEESTGGYSTEDATIFGEFQFSTKSERLSTELQRAYTRLSDRGMVGTLHFWLKKMVKTFNDGTFSWRTGAVFEGLYEQDLSSNSSVTQFLRDVYWPNSKYMGQHSTICQQVWFFCLVGIFGICFNEKQKREKYIVLIVSFIGMFLYQMLFEATARYLFVFSPILITISVIGMCQYGLLVQKAWNKYHKCKLEKMNNGNLAS